MLRKENLKEVKVDFAIKVYARDGLPELGIFKEIGEMSADNFRTPIGQAINDALEHLATRGRRGTLVEGDMLPARVLFKDTISYTYQETPIDNDPKKAIKKTIGIVKNKILMTNPSFDESKMEVTYAIASDTALTDPKSPFSKVMRDGKTGYVPQVGAPYMIISDGNSTFIVRLSNNKLTKDNKYSEILLDFIGKARHIENNSGIKIATPQFNKLMDATKKSFKLVTNPNKDKSTYNKDTGYMIVPNEEANLVQDIMDRFRLNKSRS